MSVAGFYSPGRVFVNVICDHIGVFIEHGKIVTIVVIHDLNGRRVLGELANFSVVQSHRQPEKRKSGRVLDMKSAGRDQY